MNKKSKEIVINWQDLDAGGNWLHLPTDNISKELAARQKERRDRKNKEYLKAKYGSKKEQQ